MQSSAANRRTTVADPRLPVTRGSSNARKHTSRNPIQRRLIDRFHAVILDQIAALAGPGPLRLADLGCGEGFTLESLARRRPEIEPIGIDRDPAALAEAARRVPSGWFGRAALDDLPLPDRSVDLAICLEVLEHLADPAAALREILRVTRRGVVVSVPNQPYFAAANLVRGKNWTTFGDDPDHRHRWTAGGFARWVGAAATVRRVIRPFPWVVVVAEPWAAGPDPAAGTAYLIPGIGGWA